MRAWISAAALAVATTTAHAQATSSDHETKILRCRQDPTALIWLDREGLRARCGLWASASTVKTAHGEVERIVYSRYFVVTLRDGVVSRVRQRKQIFTGFKGRAAGQ